MSCFTCTHSTPQGCELKRQEFETYAPCAAHEYEPGTDHEEKGESDD
jgi:hypothetical protein